MIANFSTPKDTDDTRNIGYVRVKKNRVGNIVLYYNEFAGTVIFNR